MYKIEPPRKSISCREKPHVGRWMLSGSAREQGNVNVTSRTNLNRVGMERWMITGRNGNPCALDGM